MRRPETITKQFFLDWEKLKRKIPTLHIAGPTLHPNPYLWKYEYWIYHAEMSYKSAADVFWKEEHKLTVAKAGVLLRKLGESKTAYAYVSSRFRRLGTGVWDYNRIREENPDVRFAPAYDYDLDEADLVGEHK